MKKYVFSLITCILTASCIASESDWITYIKLVSSADMAAIQALPAKIKSTGDNLDDEHAEQLATAISMALIRAPELVLNVTNQFELNPDPLQQRFGTTLICSIPMMIHSTNAEVETYLAKAKPALEKADSPARECLSNMLDVINEVKQEKDKDSKR